MGGNVAMESRAPSREEVGVSSCLLGQPQVGSWSLLGALSVSCAVFEMWRVFFLSQNFWLFHLYIFFYSGFLAKPWLYVIGATVG